MEKPAGKLNSLAARPAVRRGAVAVYLLAVVALSASFALQRTWDLSYNPLNGDFQSYNVFRRLLAGQRPYTDFANYIGMAPILLNMPFLLFNGSFAASLFATSFTCNLLFCFSVLLLFWLITENAPAAMVVSAALPKLVSSGVLSLLAGPRFSAYFTDLYTNLYTPSNSMRIARIIWPFLLVAAWLVFGRLVKWRGGRAPSLVTAPGSMVFCTVLGALAGLGVVWSNDFGLSVAFSASLLLVLLLLRQKPGAKVFFARLGIYLAALGLGFFTGIFLCTGGHPSAWLSFTAGVGDYQYFYFNGMAGRAALPYIFTNLRLLPFTAAPLGYLIWCAARLVQGRLTDRALLLGFLTLSVLVASYAYIISGSGYNFTEALEGYTWLAVVAVLLRALLWLLRRKRAAVCLVLAALLVPLAGVYVLTAARDAATTPAPQPGSAEVPALGGSAPYPRALGEAAALTEGEPVFSVYATGLEVVKGQLQPSGYDYIIHALGDDARARYVEGFERGRYPWVQTMSLPTERWLCVQNWDFYSRVLAGYDLAGDTEYTRLWRLGEDKRTTAEAAGATAEVVAGEGGTEIIVRGAPGQSFTADVRLCYNTRFTSGLGAALSLGRCLVGLSCEDLFGDGAWAGANLPGGTREQTIPVSVRNGVGRAVLTPQDPAFVEIEVTEAEVRWALPALTGEYLHE